MKTKLPCAVVRDLLPSYIENLTEAETTEAVKEHLAVCAACRQICENLREGTSGPADEEKEVDYLKAMRRKNAEKIVLAVVLALFLVLGGIYAELFWIGQPADGDSVYLDAKLNETLLQIRFFMPDSAMTLKNPVMRTEDSVLYVTARKTLVSPFKHPDPPADLQIDVKNLSKAVVLGRVVWQDGLLIDPGTLRLLDARTPYVGSASAVNQLLSSLNLGAPYTLELHTAQEPYGLTVHFTQEPPVHSDARMMPNACLLLALVDNLEEVFWDTPGGKSGSLTLSEIDAALPGLVQSYNDLHDTRLFLADSVKDYAADSYTLQTLRNLLGF